MRLFPFLESIIFLIAIEVIGGAASAAPRRPAWRSSRFVGKPQAPDPYGTEPAFSGRAFHRPVTVTNAPGTDRLFVVEVDGRVVSFHPDRTDGSIDAFANLKSVFPNLSQAYGLAFHPDFPRTPFVYICCILHEKQGSKIVRFQVESGEPPRIRPETQRVMLTWLAGGHNGCCLKFGPDGYLYISTGDGTGPNPPDTLRAGQDVSNLLSAILRIDVDHSRNAEPYSIPPDNPFVTLAGARPEIWAYGLRNPWKMSFDRQSGDLWVGDVGWDTWELVYQVERGGNYGWSIMEGSQPINADSRRGPTPILAPVHQHDHAEARSITGGFVYRGKRIPELVGAYVYGDFVTGKIWALWKGENRAVRIVELADTPYQIIGWCETNDGELFFADYERTGQIYRLVPQTTVHSASRFPTQLSATGLFKDVTAMTPQEGVWHYKVVAPLWEDGMSAERLMAIPGTDPIRTDRHGRWQFPSGTVIARTVMLAADRASAPPRRLETQILHLEDNTWSAYSYVWNEEQTDATLAPADGMVVSPGSAAEGQTILARSECMICHQERGDGLLGLTPWQTFTATGTPADGYSQWEQWQSIGLLPTIADGNAPRHLIDPRDTQYDIATRARSYLHANCAHCHRDGGAANSPIRLDFRLSEKQMHLIDAPATQGSFAIEGAKLLAWGDPGRSVLLYRMCKSGPGRMPHIGSRELDREAVRLIHQWIAGAERRDDGPVDWTSMEGQLDQWLQSTAGSLRLFHLLVASPPPAEQFDRIVRQATRSEQPAVRELFESLLPPSERVRRLGPLFDPSVVLARTGDPQRGRQVYWQTAGLQCRDCHQIDGQGGTLGPDLSRIGLQYDRPALLEQIVNPSLRIADVYRTHILTTKEGKIHAGRVLQKSALTILQGADGKLHRLRAEDVVDSVPSSRSLMPEQLLQALTAQQAADLLAYLSSCRAAENATR